MINNKPHQYSAYWKIEGSVL